MSRSSLILAVILAVGCSPNSPPEILRMTAQKAFVGSPFDLTLKAADPDGDTIHWSYHCPTLKLEGRARLLSLGYEARFSWTPIAPDVGDHVVDIIASDGQEEDREPVAIRVKASTTSETAPVFVKPLGEGTTLDLSSTKCLKQEVEVEDPDSPQVAFRQSPTISGATLKSTGALRALFEWCPTATQATKERHVAGLVADDKDNPPVTKSFTILLRGGGTPPKKCATTSQCPSGQVCLLGACRADTCTPKDTNGDKLFWDQSGCPKDHFCPAAGPTSAANSSHCARDCTKDSQCRSGSKCKVFDTKQGCAKEGTKVIGQSCASFTECAGIAMCLPWKGGYCAISDCSTTGGFSGKCPGGSACIPLPDKRFTSLEKHWLCLQRCTTSSNCRTGMGYKCVSLKDDIGTTLKVCK